MIREAESLTGNVNMGTAVVGRAEDVVFSDGTTLQQKFESGELKGETGANGYTPVKDVDYFDGADGKDGYTPVKGVDYFDGVDGKDGYTPQKGVDYFDGADGKDGKDGKGEKGEDGYTPVKGVDYYTESDKNEMVNLVLSALPSSEEVSY